MKDKKKLKVKKEKVVNKHSVKNEEEIEILDLFSEEKEESFVKKDKKKRKQNKKVNQKKKSSKTSKIKKKIKIKRKAIFILIGLILFLAITSFFGIKLYKDYKEELFRKQEEERIKKEYENLLLDIKNSYNKYVLVNKESNLYNENEEIVGKISKDMYLELEDIGSEYEKEFYKLKNLDMYIHFKDVSKTGEKVIDSRYKNYIPFNKSVITRENTKLYTEDKVYYITNQVNTLPIIIDETDRYYVSFDNKLVYVYKNEVDVVDANNSNEKTLNEIAILNYHFVINESEKSECVPLDICHDESQFDSHISYIKENNFFTITMKELDLFLDYKINLPKKSVSITIDDGWFVDRSIPILEKYDVMATLFLIGHLNPPSYYESKNLEIHSHTWDLHDVSNCKAGRSQLLCYNKQTIIEDLKKSRESLNNTTYFCYPFYEYNNNAISALKEAGFTMALTGGNRKAKRGVDKFKVPRQVIYNTTSVKKLSQIIN